MDSPNLNDVARSSRMISWLRVAVSCVWLYQGLWHKILEVDGRHRVMMEQALGAVPGYYVMKALGTFEVMLGLFILLGWWPRLTALAQTLLLVGMNGAGIYFAGEHIPDIGGMLTMNLVLILAAWLVAVSSVKTPLAS